MEFRVCKNSYPQIDHARKISYTRFMKFDGLALWRYKYTEPYWEAKKWKSRVRCMSAG